MSGILNFCLVFFVAFSSPCFAAEKVAEVDMPNVLLIVVDDMGMADLASFGGEIPTPNIDSLAMAGTRFTNFHSAPVCSATRVMLLTGVDNHKAGIGNMAEELAPNQVGMPGYEGEINHRVITIASILKNQGYQTYMAGKWHLGMTEASSPWARGFDRSFALLPGGASHFSDMKPAYHPDPKGKAPYRQDQHMLDKLPANFEYSTQFYADEMIRYIEQGNSDKPYFAYLSFTAPHWPLQAPQKTVEKYQGKYDIGYDVISQQRLDKQKQLGIVPNSAEINKPTTNRAPWSDLDKGQQQTLAKSMEIYAAMIEEIDNHTGRVIDTLRQRGELENTIVIFLSDNGAEGHDVDETWPMEKFPKIRTNINARHDFSYENMGRPNSYVFYGAEWAQASSPVYNLYKGFPTEGGTRVPAFITYPKYFEQGLNHSYSNVKDIVPTLLDISGIGHPRETNSRLDLEAPTGYSMLQSSNPYRIEGSEILGKYSVRKGQWKIVNMPAPYGNGSWQLYNLSNDLSESQDLSQQHPEMLTELIKEWQNYKTKNGVILPNEVSGY
jgi:arylsulfatase A-like enzyme